MFDEKNMSTYAVGQNSVVYEHPLNSGSLVKIMNKSEAELNETMGELNIGPKVVITARKDSNGMYNHIMPKLKGDTLENLWPNMEFSSLQFINEESGKKGPEGIEWTSGPAHHWHIAIVYR